MMKKLAMWLNDHAVCVGDSLKANVLHLWCFLLSFIAITAFLLFGKRGLDIEILLAVMFLGGTFIPPVYAGVEALIKKQPWTPWYWFPIAMGCVFGCILSIVVGIFFGYITIW